jgi:hypothetical protein
VQIPSTDNQLAPRRTGSGHFAPRQERRISTRCTGGCDDSSEIRPLRRRGTTCGGVVKRFSEKNGHGCISAREQSTHPSDVAVLFGVERDSLMLADQYRHRLA